MNHNLTAEHLRECPISSFARDSIGLRTKLLRLYLEDQREGIPHAPTAPPPLRMTTKSHFNSSG